MAENMMGVLSLMLGVNWVLSRRPVRSLFEFELGWLCSQIGAQLHGLAKRVDGGVGHLAGVEQQLVPVDPEYRKGCPCQVSNTPPESACL